jgi:hypothetical protein
MVMGADDADGNGHSSLPLPCVSWGGGDFVSKGRRAKADALSLYYNSVIDLL